MNLPNTITVGRIAVSPLIATLVVNSSWFPRLSAWLLFVAAAVTDYVDGKLARDRNLVTNLGKMLDPIADKLLLIATLLPMYWLMRDVALLATDALQHRWAVAGTPGPVVVGSRWMYPFVTPLGLVGLPLWIVAIVIGREVFMILFRQVAARRGVVISAIGPAKWKTAFQSVWVGAAFFWFMAATAAAERRWSGPAWDAFAMFNGTVGALCMAGAVLLTLYSLLLYIRRYGAVVLRGVPTDSARS
ncbi:MAG TPA: CDP-alcohol phosphatidyltransferase family protein [Gemmatimonadaceae bacterium]|nr:CDP-alcohol phosphatidyltransferase family protein [Gemmatimonadaceae bacterium]